VFVFFLKHCFFHADCLKHAPTSQPDAVTPFVFPVTGAAVRVTAQDGEPWFVAKDVCDALGIGSGNLSRDLDADEQGVIHLMTPGGKQEIKIVNESGLYELVFKSRKPEAKAFKKWVKRDVLPAIRKDGGYVLGEERVKTGEMSEDELMARALIIIPKYDHSRVPP
jgi:prophage antirepressor-like protein